MVRVLHFLALVALVAVSATASAETVERRQEDAAVTASHQVRMLAAQAGSGSGTAGATVNVPAANQAILDQWTVAKGMLEKAFASEPTLLASLKEFEKKVAAALQTEVTLDQAKAIITEWFTSLEKDPAFAKVSAQLAPLKAVLAGGAGATSTVKTGSGSGGASISTVGKTTAPTTSSPSSSSNSSSATPAPTSAASKTVAAFVVPAVVAIAGVIASL